MGAHLLWEHSPRTGAGVAAPRLQSPGSGVLVLGLSCSLAREVFPDQGWNLHWQADSLPLSYQGSPHQCLLIWNSCLAFIFYDLDMKNVGRLLYSMCFDLSLLGFLD